MKQPSKRSFIRKCKKLAVLTNLLALGGQSAHAAVNYWGLTPTSTVEWNLIGQIVVSEGSVWNFPPVRNFRVGSPTVSPASISVIGAGSQLNIVGADYGPSVYLGIDGQGGNIVILDGGLLNVGGSGTGSVKGYTGDITVSGTGSRLVTGSMEISGTARGFVNGGASVEVEGLYLFSELTVSGSGSSLTVLDNFAVYGELTIESGAVLTTAGEIWGAEGSYRYSIRRKVGRLHADSWRGAP